MCLDIKGLAELFSPHLEQITGFSVSLSSPSVNRVDGSRWLRCLRTLSLPRGKIPLPFNLPMICDDFIVASQSFDN